jgi:hypothetical protein
MNAAVSATGSAAPAKATITDEDAAGIRELIDQFNADIKTTLNPLSSSLPLDKLLATPSYKALLQYDAKLLPFLIRQWQAEQDSRVLVGSVRAERKIAGQDDLYEYQKERAARVKTGVMPWLNWPGLFILADTTVGKALDWRYPPRPTATPFSWIDWWEDHQGEFEFRMTAPPVIETGEKYYNHPHITTWKVGDLLMIDAVHVTYRQIIERAAAELGIDVFIGAQDYMDIITTVRMRGVTFEEFAYLVGRTVSVRPLTYRKTDDGYHFGGKEPSVPRRIMRGWGIAMGRTVFTTGEPIPVIIVARKVGEMVDPADPAFSTYGSFRITDNAGKIVREYLPQRRDKPTLPLFHKEKDGTEITLRLGIEADLPPGEYNVSFKYMDEETPSYAFEIYERAGN